MPKQLKLVLGRQPCNDRIGEQLVDPARALGLAWRLSIPYDFPMR